MINISISTNLLIIISCLVLLIIAGIIAYIIYKDKKNDQKEIDDLMNDIVKAKPREDVKVTKIESKPSKEPVNLEEMLKTMEKNLDKEKDTISNYEQEQEENAIISYSELLKQNKANIDEYEQNQEKKAKISISEISSLDNLNEKEEIMMNSVRKAISNIESPREQKDKKFKGTDFISPIFGKMDNKIEYPKVKAFDKTADLTINEYFGEDINSKYDSVNRLLNIEKLDDEIKRNDEFLKALKEFRNNL